MGALYYDVQYLKIILRAILRGLAVWKSRFVPAGVLARPQSI